MQYQCFSIETHLWPCSLEGSHDQGTLGPLWSGVFNFFLKRFPNGIISNVTGFVRRHLTRCQIACFAFRNFRSGFGLLTHKSPISIKPGKPLQEIAADNYLDMPSFSFFETEIYRIPIKIYKAVISYCCRSLSCCRRILKII